MFSKEIIITVMFTIVNIEYIIIIIKRFGMNLKNDKVFSRFTSHFSIKTPAFTLAEVLITLGIIGVVAAMTLPTMIMNHRKQVTVNKVKKFYTVMSQATNSAIAEYGSMEDWQGFTTTRNGEEMQNWFDTYLKPYLKVIDEFIKTDEETGHSTLFVILSDGSVINMTNWAGSAKSDDNANHVQDNHNGLIHLSYLTDKKLIDDVDSRIGCVNTFSFLFYSPLKDQYFFQPYTYQANTPEKYNREFFIEQVKGGNYQYCAAVMMFDGWQIKSDYPFQTKKDK